MAYKGFFKIVASSLELKEPISKAVANNTVLVGFRIVGGSSTISTQLNCGEEQRQRRSIMITVESWRPSVDRSSLDIPLLITTLLCFTYDDLYLQTHY